ncbi:glycosyltransferase family 2 protein [Patescibacteria group bacterium]
MKKDQAIVSVVIPNYNGESLIEKNLPHILSARENIKNRIKEIIMVDDGSYDKSVKIIKNKFPEVRLIKHRVNRGFSASVNTGARSAKGSIMLLLNTDVIPQKNFLEKALKHFEDEKVFAVSLHEKGYGWAKGSFFDGYVQLAKGAESKKEHISFYVSGGSGLFRRKLWMDLGGMDEKLLSPFYWEDIDICYRAAKRGLKLLWEPSGTVLHKHESTIGKLSAGFVARVRERNQLLFVWKNIGSPTLTRRHIVGVLKRLAGHPGYLRVIIMALTRLKLALRAREREIKESKVSDEVIFARFK